ncbi:baculoviral IAP repeat-containing protein 3-like [Neocloeon triangulifer]|uniref:baculoviral IAP repeat-containing protein 3-like n=1 Tax=Neocloeon triangulifer TaxID=2078957 RepID=UPI00286F0B88|nr:baculoviral IAP repeat-containing protein 3-like [Neocloeon triangulifer]
MSMNPGCPGAPIQNNTNLNFNIELHRILTFPEDFKNKCCVDPEFLAKAGFYCFHSNGDIRLRCNFCTKEILREEIRNEDELKRLKEHNCCVNSADSENVPFNVKQLDFKFESHRLYAFLKKDNWKFVTPADLAKDGFYYTGEEDNCHCHFCKLEIRGWEEGDLVRSEHQRWNAECPFLKNPSSEMNIPIGKELDSFDIDRAVSTIPGVTFPFMSSKDLLKNFGARVTLSDTKVSPLSLNIQQWSKSSHPQYSTVSERLKTFRKWPKTLNQKPKALAWAGFFYAELGDRVICFHCNLGLKEWEPHQDPLERHERWNENCQYLIMAKEEKLRKNEELDAENRRESVMCVKCGEEEVAIVNLPCGHAQLCAATACSDGDCCTKCGNNVNGRVRFFF